MGVQDSAIYLALLDHILPPCLLEAFRYAITRICYRSYGDAYLLRNAVQLDCTYAWNFSEGTTAVGYAIMLALIVGGLHHDARPHGE